MVDAVMIGTTHFTNALVERKHLDRVGIIRLASPSGDALPPLTAWPDDLAQQIGGDIFLLPGGYEVDGREIAPFDQRQVRAAAQVCRQRGIDRIAGSSAFPPVHAHTRRCAAAVFPVDHPAPNVSPSPTTRRQGVTSHPN